MKYLSGADQKTPHFANCLPAIKKKIICDKISAKYINSTRHFQTGDKIILIYLFKIAFAGDSTHVVSVVAVSLCNPLRIKVHQNPCQISSVQPLSGERIINRQTGTFHL